MARGEGHYGGRNCYKSRPWRLLAHGRFSFARRALTTEYEIPEPESGPSDWMQKN